MARPSNTGERRVQIAHALLKVMAATGYEGASIAHIAKTARIPSGIVHYHFKNKQEILIAAMEELARRHNEAMDAAEAGALDPAGRLLAFIDLHLGLGATADAQTVACWVMLSCEAIRQPRIRTEYRKVMTEFAGRAQTVIRSGVREGVFRCDDEAAVAAALVATIQGYFVLAAAAPSVIPSGSAASAARRMAEGLLKPARPFARERVP